MKKLKRLILFIFLIVVVITLVNCWKVLKPMFIKDALTVETFSEYFDETWLVADARDLAELSEDDKLPVLDNIYVAENTENFMQIWFYDFIDIESAKEMYSESLVLVNDFIEGSSVKSTSEATGSNFAKFIGGNGSQTWLITQVDDTVIYAEVLNSNAKTVETILKDLNY